MNLIKSFGLTVIVALQPLTSLLAHPGHGHKDLDGNSVWHYLTEPVHILSFGVVLVLIFAARFYFLKSQKQSKAKELKDK